MQGGSGVDVGLYVGRAGAGGECGREVGGVEGVQPSVPDTPAAGAGGRFGGGGGDQDGAADGGALQCEHQERAHRVECVFVQDGQAGRGQLDGKVGLGGGVGVIGAVGCDVEHVLAGAERTNYGGEGVQRAVHGCRDGGVAGPDELRVCGHDSSQGRAVDGWGAAAGAGPRVARGDVLARGLLRRRVALPLRGRGRWRARWCVA